VPGFPCIAVVNAATGNSSNRLGNKEKFGQIKPSYMSRLILMHHSPLKTISNLRKQKSIVFDGVVFENDENLDSNGL
jgi:imidazolonepropionase-like amidohydrolase